MKDVGAAVFVMGQAVVRLLDCTLFSIAGFSIWCKHEGNVFMQNCLLLRSGRTGIACFNSSKVTAIDCDIENSQVHGVCARGSVDISLTNCSIYHSGIRGCYVYLIERHEGGDAKLTLRDVQISYTGLVEFEPSAAYKIILEEEGLSKNPVKAALEVANLMKADSNGAVPSRVVLDMQGCKFFNNHCDGFVSAGQVAMSNGLDLWTISIPDTDAASA